MYLSFIFTYYCADLLGWVAILRSGCGDFVGVAHREMEAKVRNLRMELRDKNKEYDKTEDDLKALQSVGQIIGELLRQLDDERYIVKASSGPRYVVGCRNKVNPDLSNCVCNLLGRQHSWVVAERQESVRTPATADFLARGDGASSCRATLGSEWCHMAPSGATWN